MPSHCSSRSAVTQASRMRSRCFPFDPTDMDQGRGEVTLIPAKNHEALKPKAMAVSKQDFIVVSRWPSRISTASIDQVAEKVGLSFLIPIHWCTAGRAPCR